MKPIIYYKENYEGMICYICDTDYSKYDHSPSLTLFKIGWFREHEKESVVMITNIMKPQKDRYKYFYFKTKKESNKFIIDYIKKCKGVLK